MKPVQYCCGYAERSNYYPFGMLVPETAVDKQPYKYGGKEFDRMNGLNFYDFTARHYDPALIRFTSPDPLAEKLPGISPYTYCAANPIIFIDPTGKRIEFDKDVTAEQRQSIESLNPYLEKSNIFNKIFKSLKDSENLYTVKFGETEVDGNNAAGGYYPETKTISYENSNLSFAPYIEELVHAYQDEIGLMQDNSVNKEFEAKIITLSVINQSSVVGSFGGMYENFGSSILYTFFTNIGINGLNVEDNNFNSIYKNMGAEFVRVSTVDTYKVKVEEPSQMLLYLLKLK